MTTAASIALYFVAAALAAGFGASLEEKRGTGNERDVLPGLVLIIVIFLIAVATQVSA